MGVAAKSRSEEKRESANERDSEDPLRPRRKEDGKVGRARERAQHPLSFPSSSLPSPHILTLVYSLLDNDLPLLYDAREQSLIDPQPVLWFSFSLLDGRAKMGLIREVALEVCHSLLASLDLVRVEVRDDRFDRDRGSHLEEKRRRGSQRGRKERRGGGGRGGHFWMSCSFLPSQGPVQRKR